jgi:hypothetical protein
MLFPASWWDAKIIADRSLKGRQAAKWRRPVGVLLNTTVS